MPTKFRYVSVSAIKTRNGCQLPSANPSIEILVDAEPACVSFGRKLVVCVSVGPSFFVLLFLPVILEHRWM